MPTSTTHAISGANAAAAIHDHIRLRSIQSGEDRNLKRNTIPNTGSAPRSYQMMTDSAISRCFAGVQWSGRGTNFSSNT